MFLAWVLAACTAEVTVLHEAPSCADPEATGIQVVSDETGVHVSHSGGVYGCDDAFEPQVSVTRHDLDVVEAWTALTTDACTACFDAVITFTDLPAATWHVAWYVEGDGDPIDVIDVVVE